jgi:putative ABC transport system permease protein
MTFLSKLFRRRRYDDLTVSIREHIAERADELVGEGMPRAEAEQTARRAFGNVGLVEQRSREVWQWPTVESVFADIRFALRQLIKSPGFTITAVVTLALGIAVNATMFSMVSAFLLPHLPGRDPQSMVVVSSVNPDSQFQPDANPASAPNYLAWSKDTRVFSAMAAADEYRTGSLAGKGLQPEALTYAAVSPNYFPVFGVSPALGRAFVAGEDQPGRDHVLVLSHGLWERRFGSDASVVGRVVRLNREDYVVAGVMPADFRLLGFTPQLWTPLTLTASDATADARKNRSLYLFARLAPGIKLEQARVQMRMLGQQAQQDYPAIEGRWGAAVRTLPDFLIYNFGIGTALAVIMTVVGFVLFIACANVAGLLLTRAVGRQKELAIRMSLGATRVRVVRQLLTEGVVIALLGGGVGLFLTYFGIRVISAGLSFNDAIADVKISLDTNVLIFAAVVSLVSAVLSSVAPALKASRTEINTDLKSEGRGASSGRAHNRMRVFLVGGEIALALFLLIGSCLLIRGVSLIEHQKLGFNHDHLLTAGLVLDKARYADSSKQIQFVRGLIERARQIPGVEKVAVASDLPASGLNSVTFHIKGQTEAHSNDQHTAADVVVTPEYFEVAGVPLLRGRLFTGRDDATAPHVVMVNQEFVHKYFQDRDPLGKQIQLDVARASPAWSEIVGVVSDVKSYSEDARVDPEVFEAYLQRPVASFSLMLRSTVEPKSLASSLRQAIAQLDRELPLLRVMSMDDVIEAQKNGDPLFTKLLGTFAILALILSAIGIYGLIAYSVGQRTHEIGIRLALGAKASDISRMILRDGFKVAAIGSAIGLLMALPLPKLFESIFHGLVVGGPEVYPVVLAVMLIVAFCATFGPARRAVHVDPTTALRNE